MALLGLYAISWRRLLNFPRLIVTNPYVTFAAAAIALVGLAYSSFANLGVLTRQKSLIFPLLLLLPCLPVRTWQRPPDSARTSRTAEHLARNELRSTEAGDVLPTTTDHASTNQSQPLAVSPADQSMDDLWA